MNLKQFVFRLLQSLEMFSVHLICSLPIHRPRVWILKAWGAQVGPGVTIYHGTEVRSARHLRIGENSSIGNDAILDARGGLAIGSNVNLSTGVHIWTGQHDWTSPTFAYLSAPVSIGDGAWLSGRVTVLPGVQFGKHAVAASGAVVVADVAPRVLVGGVPAKVLGERPEGIDYQLPSSRYKAWWW